MTTHRAKRVADLVRDRLSEIVARELRDPRVGFVTVTAVEVSSDLRHARVFVTTLGSGAERAASLAALNHAAPFLKRSLAQRTRLRRTPDLRFVEDTAVARGSRIEALLAEMRDDGGESE